MSQNPNLPESLWKLLLHDEVFSRVAPIVALRFLAQYPNGLPIVLEHYAESKTPLVRLIVLLHPQTPMGVLTEKSRSSVWLERCAVAQNPSTPTKVLNNLAEDGNRIVRAAATNLQSRSQQP